MFMAQCTTFPHNRYNFLHAWTYFLTINPDTYFLCYRLVLENEYTPHYPDSVVTAWLHTWQSQFKHTPCNLSDASLTKNHNVFFFSSTISSELNPLETCDSLPPSVCLATLRGKLVSFLWAVACPNSHTLRHAALLTDIIDVGFSRLSYSALSIPNKISDNKFGLSVVIIPCTMGISTKSSTWGVGVLSPFESSRME